MGTTSEQWLSRWVEQVDVLLRSPLPAFPYRAILPLLAETFQSVPTWHVMGLDGRMHMEMFNPPSRWPDEAVMAAWAEDRWWEHPLTRWFMMTQSVRAMTTGRVPSGIVVAGGQEFVDSQLRPHDLHQQLCLPIGGTHGTSWNLLLAQGGGDFTDGQVELARALQPLLMVLDRQTRAVGTLSPSQRRRVADWELTGRETAVLRLLARGLTADGIARHLGCAPRTVDKHLEHTYRKLGVRDRVSAARLAAGHGFASRAPEPDEGTQRPLDERITVLDGKLRPLTPELLG